MRKIDYHMHTCFSADSEANPQQHIEQAIKMGLDEICFTDHQDFHYPGTSFDVDVDHYLETMQDLKKTYQDQLKIKVGIEIGLDCLYQDEIQTFIETHPFDYVIGSIHAIRNTEFFLPGKFFDGKTKEEAHREFFEETLRCVQQFDDFNCLGHLDYIVRYGPYEDKSVNHASYQDIIDEIFKTLIKKGKGIEVNTSGFKDLKTCGFPNFEQVQRYYDLGGRIITIGTDSHTSDRVGENVDRVVKELEKIGFKDVSTFTKRVKDSI
ncbi:MAG: histidinol-phosphatase HisJ family protein [Beduini sp.]|uniref:histidinol-phosphatase HisJ family protein n=1 Tax=Beduini sp. TaxID=1922300 RepID=UPI00399FB417